MIAYDIDPSLHTGEPVPPQLDDGFSPPVETSAQAPVDEVEQVDPALWKKSEF